MKNKERNPAKVAGVPRNGLEEPSKRTPPRKKGRKEILREFQDSYISRNKFHHDHIVTLTGKKRGQLNMFHDKIQEDSGYVPDDLIGLAVSEWDVFCSFAKADQGAFDCPRYPDPGFMLKFIDSAIEFWRETYPEDDED